MSWTGSAGEGMACIRCGLTEAEVQAHHDLDPGYCPHGEPHDWEPGGSWPAAE